MKNKRKIAVVITARPSYSRVKTALKAIDEHPNLELILIVAASALLDKYGSAVEVIERDGFRVSARIYNNLEGGNLLSQAKTTGLGILELSNLFAEMKPDAVVTIADRFETMATAISASYQNIPLIHLQGGEVTGNIDEKVRHAITKLADLHLVSTNKARERVIKMGEIPENVICTGCPSIDIITNKSFEKKLTFNIYQKYGGVGYQPDIENGYLVVLLHPETEVYDRAREQTELVLHTVTEIGLPVLWFWPNVDAGTDGTSKAIRLFREKNDRPNFHFFRNMVPEDFLELLNQAQCLIGNSSVGIRECSYMGVPVVNIGDRQSGRERGKNVTDVPFNQKEIEEAIRLKMDQGKISRDVLYGSGKSGKKIADSIANWALTYSKKLSY